MEDLKTLVATHYSPTTFARSEAKTKKKIFKAIKKFVSANDTVLDQDLDFIKEITKVAHHVIDDNPLRLNELTRRLHKYCLEGVEVIHKLRAEKEQNHSETRLTAMESHLYNYAGYFAGIEGEKGKLHDKLHWLGERYRLTIQSAEISKGQDPQYYLSSHRYASKYASAVSTMLTTENPNYKTVSELEKWANRSYESAVICAEHTIDHNPTTAFLNFNSIATQAKKNFDTFESKNWLIRAKDAYQRMSDAAKDLNSEAHDAMAREARKEIRNLTQIITTVA